MKKPIYICLVISIILNVLLAIFLLAKCNNNTASPEMSISQEEIMRNRQQKAETLVRKLVCENLYYPNTYDPVKTTIDSVFYGPLTDGNTVQAAFELIELQDEYNSQKNKYDYAVDQIKFFGRTDLGTNHWGKDRDNAKSKMNEIQTKIEKKQNIIKNRDTSNDGNFIGWQIIHRYRAANSEGVVSFGDVLYVVNPELNEYYFRYSLDDNNSKNLKNIRDIIETTLGIKQDI